MFNIGDKVFNPETPNKIYKVIDVNTVTSYIPNYTLLDEDGETEWESYCIKWHKVVTEDEVLKKGRLLTYDSFNENHLWDSNVFTEISTIQYDNRIFYIKQVDYEVVEFKELTV